MAQAGEFVAVLADQVLPFQMGTLRVAMTPMRRLACRLRLLVARIPDAISVTVAEILRIGHVGPQASPQRLVAVVADVFGGVAAPCPHPVAPRRDQVIEERLAHRRHGAVGHRAAVERDPRSDWQAQIVDLRAWTV